MSELGAIVHMGAGLQMALFDAVGRTAEVPAHALLGKKVHDTTPLSWWNIDTSAKDMAAEPSMRIFLKRSKRPR